VIKVAMAAVYVSLVYICCLQISRCTCGCRLRCGPVAHQRHGSVATDKLSEDENDVTGVHYGRFMFIFTDIFVIQPKERKGPIFSTAFKIDEEVQDS